MPDLVQRAELGAFLRARREATDPASVGVEPGPRRRTPGLRREELAQLSGLSVTWYTWLEQARDITVSRQVVNSLARALRLGPSERTHLFTLAGLALPAERRRPHPVDPLVRAADPRFLELWNEHGVAGFTSARKQLIHPELGRLNLDYSKLVVAGDEQQSLIVFFPADDTTERVLEKFRP